MPVVVSVTGTLVLPIVASDDSLTGALATVRMTRTSLPGVSPSESIVAAGIVLMPDDDTLIVQLVAVVVFVGWVDASV